jgi:tRNA(His) guanylyltransferase
MNFDDLSARCKAFEKRFTGETLMPGIPVIARLDGRAFHTFTRGLVKPFDFDLIEAMRQTTAALVDEFNADLGYTQSDEITLVWFSEPESELMFGGKLFKLNSVLASTCSVIFFKKVMEYLPSKADKTPIFDCRTWQVPDMNEAALVLYWRERDATRNSVNMLAQSLFSHKQLQGKNVPAVHDMLHEKGVNWNDLPSRAKRGSYFHRVLVDEVLDLSDRLDIPVQYRVPKQVVRSRVEEKDIPILTFDRTLIDQLFK